MGSTLVDQAKPHCVIQALKGYYGASIGVSGERQKFLRLIQQEGESIGDWESRVRNQAAQCEYENFEDELMRDQFIAGLVSEQGRVKLIGKGHRHKDGYRQKVSLREVVKVAKAYEATTITNKLMKDARENNQQEQVNYSSNQRRQSTNRDRGREDFATAEQAIATRSCSWCADYHKQPRQKFCPAFRRKCNKCGILGHFSKVCRSTSNGRRYKEKSHQIQHESEEELFVVDSNTNAINGKRFFANLTQLNGGKPERIKVQIDSASTCNTIPFHWLVSNFPG